VEKAQSGNTCGAKALFLALSSVKKSIKIWRRSFSKKISIEAKILH
jgi:hypothetical protein